MPWSVPTSIRRWMAQETTAVSLRVMLALLSVAIPAWYLQTTHHIIPFVLGIIAAALAETDDSLRGKSKSLLMTLLCFAIASFSVELLFPYPWLFCLGLFSSCFGFIMLGAIGPRYASIAFASILLAIYTMIGAHVDGAIWEQPAALLMGAASYGALSLFWQWRWPLQSSQRKVADVFEVLANTFAIKAELIAPVRDLNPQPYRLRAAQNNATVVQHLDLAKNALLQRARRKRFAAPNERLLSLYFLAQDIHERINSTHYRYQELSQDFHHSDVLFRCQRLLQLQQQACLDLAHSLRTGQRYEHAALNQQALYELHHSVSYLKGHRKLQWQASLRQLDYLSQNLSAVEQQLQSLTQSDGASLVIESNTDERTLADNNPHTLVTMWQQVRSQLSLQSPLCRHAIRLSSMLTLGYILIQAFNISMGYWIMLTTLFVCQPTYSETKKKLGQRVAGTLVGLMVGIPLLYLVPSAEGQLAIMVFTGVLFFIYRTKQYAFATCFITLLVLSCFNQFGEGYAVMLPRLGDTLLGCILAVLAVIYVLPDWQAKRLPKAMAETLAANSDYLDQVLIQYRTGKRDDLAYRVARRQAHNADARLTNIVTAMLGEPERRRYATDASFRFLCLSHALLNYISALGAHRARIEDSEVHLFVNQAHGSIHQALDTLVKKVEKNDQTLCSHCLLDAKPDNLGHLSEQGQLITQQLELIHRLLPEFDQLVNRLIQVTQGQSLNQTTEQNQK
nr:YccS family putative transporter [Vibrio stylophorae]